MRGRNVPPPTPSPEMIVVKLRGVHSFPDAYTAIAQLAEDGLGGAWHLHASHDDGCTSITTKCDADCQCNPDFALLNEKAHESFMAFARIEGQTKKARWN